MCWIVFGLCQLQDMWVPLRFVVDGRQAMATKATKRKKVRIKLASRNLTRSIKTLTNATKAILAWMRSRWRGVSLALQISAIVLVILGWYLDQGHRSEWVVRVFAPYYADASDTCNKMFQISGLESDSGVAVHHSPVVLRSVTFRRCEPSLVSCQISVVQATSASG